MNKKKYEAMRKKLMDETQGLLDAGKVDEANAKMEEIKALDEKWDSIAQAAANFAALNGTQAAKNPIGDVEDFLGGEEDFGDENPKVKAWKSEEYKNAWAKHLMEKPMSDSEKDSFFLVNEAYTHTTKNTSIVIPETVSIGIWEMAGEYYPYFADVTKTYVNGLLTMIQEDSSSEATWYEEDNKAEDGKETFKEYTLGGCELSRAITVSWKLREMAIEDFIPYIQRKMAKKMGAAAGYGVTHGAGEKAVSGKPEPMGTVTALEAEEGTPQVVEYAKGTVPKYDNIVNARSKVKSGYGAGLAIYANSYTIWNRIAMIQDENKRPLFVPDVTSQGQFRILGIPVKEDDSMKDGEILFSNTADGYHLNVNKEISMMTEDHVKDRTTDYVGYAIMDGNIVTSKAHALLKEAAVAET
ncbi:MAG: phage major capsid protein [Lachnospiraceae bacterium]|nr:phage major capsid protein [Lachnospiraceae bacterium]